MAACASCWSRLATCIGIYDGDEHSEPEPACDPEPCPDCGGDGYVEVDGCDSRGEHTSRALPCRTCADVRDRGDAEPEPSEPDPDAEVAW